MSTEQTQWSYLKFRTDDAVETYRYTFYDDFRRMSVYDVVDQWLNSSDFCDFFTSVLNDTTLAAYFLEMAPFPLDEKQMAAREFELVTVFSRPLAKAKPDPQPFMNHLEECRGYVANFTSLGGYTMLVVPCLPNKRESWKHYTSIRPFVGRTQKNSFRHTQQRLLWQKVAQCVLGMVDRNAECAAHSDTAPPLWISTSGLEVSWLHVRMDLKPKYISYKPYKLMQATPPCVVSVVTASNQNNNNNNNNK